uniref:Evasin n=1 Tax=Amblyomma parvum TaxID=251391 RepID=A0A023G2W8_AMBPA
MAFGSGCIFFILLFASTTVFTLSDGNEEDTETSTSCTTSANSSSYYSTEGNASATIFALTGGNEDVETTNCTTSSNVSSYDDMKGNDTATTDAPTTNATKRRRRRPERTTEPPDPTCSIYIASTDGDPVLIGCTIYCENYTKPFGYRRECVNITLEAASAMQNRTRYICPMGFCLNGYCYKTGMKLPCWLQ